MTGWDGFETLYSDPEDCTLLVLRSKDNKPFQAYTDDHGEWVLEEVRFNDEMTEFVAPEDAELVYPEPELYEGA